jgi:osmotically-inducible protein OsmY
MARRPGENPKSYEDIVRATVVDPDSSQRPTTAQEHAAHHGYRAVDGDEQALHDAVARALAAAGGDTSEVAIEVARDLVTLRGRVASSALLRQIEDAVAAVPGVATIHNQLVIAANARP